MKRTFLCVVVLLVLAAGSVGAPPVTAQPSQTPRQPRTDILQLVSQTSVVEPDGDFTMRLRVVGVPAGARIRLQVRSRVPTRSDFKQALAGHVSRSGVGQPVETPAVPDASGVVVATISTRDPQSLQPARPQDVRLGEGVYPVSVDLLGNSGAALDSLLTFLIRLPTSREFAPLGVAVVLPVGGRLARQANGTTALDPTLAQQALSHATVLEAHSTVPVTIAPTPETVDSLEQKTLDELRKGAAGRQITLTPYVRMRPADWLAVGLDAEVGREFDRGAATIAAKLGAPDQTTYVTDDGVTSVLGDVLRQRGARSLIVPDTAVSRLDERVFNRTLTQPFRVSGLDGVQAAAADRDLSAHVGETGDPVLDANHLLADLAVLYFDDPPDKRAAVVAFTDDQHIDPQLLDALLTGLDPVTDRILQPMTLATMFASVPRAGSKGETNGKGTPLERTLAPAAGTNLSTFATNLRSAERDLDSYRSMITADNPLAARFEDQLLAAGANELTQSDRTAYLDGLRSGIRAETGKIEPPPRQTINFTARDGVVSLTIRNTTGYPVKVGLRLQGEKLEFPGHEDGAFDVTLTQETTRVTLNVRTRASGDSPLDVTVTAPDGELQVGRTRITVRSTAFSGVGLVLSVGAGTFLAVWWIRHAVTTRRDRRRRLKHAAGKGG